MADNITTSQPLSTARPSRGLDITLWALQVVLALAFVFSGIMKLTGSPQAVGIFEAMGTSGWMPYVIGLLEIIGAVALVTRRLSGLAALAFTGLMAGAVISHLIWGGPALPAVVLLILSALLAFGRRSSITELLASRR